MNTELKRGFKLIGSIILLGIPFAIILQFSTEHHNIKTFISGLITTGINAWIYVKWWILEGLKYDRN